jgi:hypothetical protein
MNGLFRGCTVDGHIAQNSTQFLSTTRKKNKAQFSVYVYYDIRRDQCASQNRIGGWKTSEWQPCARVVERRIFRT